VTDRDVVDVGRQGDANCRGVQPITDALEEKK
jgi:hypothetical protein